MVSGVYGIHEVGGSIPPGSTNFRRFRQAAQPPNRAVFSLVLRANQC
jgi:hypothetical protein